MPTTVLYRIAGGQVIRISKTGFPFPTQTRDYFEVLTDPAFPDGMENQEDIPPDQLGQFFVLGFQKIAIPGTNVVRNATQAEIDQMIIDENDDNEELLDDASVALLTTHPSFKRVFSLLVDEINAPGLSSVAGAAARKPPKRNPRP